MNEVFYEDCVFGMSEMACESVDLVVTSPPYKNIDGYSDKLIFDCFTEVYRVLKNDSLCFVNFGHLAEDKFRPFRVCQILMEIGFNLKDTIVWSKNHYKPIQGKRCLNNLSEFIFMMYKNKMPKLDRLSIGIPYKDKSNAKRFAGGKDLKCAGNIWHIPYETIQSKKEKLHNDRFPLALSEKCIKLSGIKKGSLILEPFAGSGTTCVSAKKLGMNFIGFEKNLEYKSIIEKRLNDCI